jgi:hypothetical protein
VSETRATTPAFPPGRYGRRRSPAGRRRLFPVVFAVLVLAFSALLTVQLDRRYGDPDYKSRIVGWTIESDTRMTIDFAVQVPRGGTAECLLRGRSYDGLDVGQGTTTVSNPGAAAELRGRAEVVTKARASAGDVLRCHPAG